VALKVVLAEFGAIETVAGTAMLLVEVNATVTPTEVGLLNVTVQTATAPGPSVAGVQETRLSTELFVVVTVPPVALIGSGAPASAVPSEPDTATAAVFEVGANVIDAVATTPFAITLVLVPVATQVYPLGDGAQFKVFAAALRAGPPVTEKPATEPAG